MDINLNCNQVEALINFYIEGKLAPSLKSEMDEHISKCSKCRQKIEQLKNVLSQYESKNYKTQNENLSHEFISKLSAYIDNELDTTDNVKIKKITISNPSARKRLESMYSYQKLMHSVFEKTKNNTKFDYSKNIVSALNKSADYNTTYFRNIIILFCIIILAIISGFVYLYF